MNRHSFVMVKSLRRQNGLSLIELMVALAIGLFLTTGVVAIYASMVGATRTSSLEAQLNEDGALALQILRQQLQQAGYSGLRTGNDGVPNFTGVSVLGCDGGFADIDKNYMGSLTGSESPACGTETTDPDAIAVRYQADLQNTVAIRTGTSSSPLDLPSNCAYERIGNWRTEASGTPSYPLAENRFYIAQDAANNNAKTLFCKGITSNTDGTEPKFGDPSALIPNVEDMQLTYAITTVNATSGARSPQITGIVSASGAPSADPSNPTAPTPAAYLGTTLSNWNRVVGVHICVLLRSSQPASAVEFSASEIGFYTDCAGETVTNSSDRFLRRAFRTTVAFRNLQPTIPKSYIANGDPWAKEEN